MPSAWKPLHLQCEYNGIPPLLVKYEFGPSDYKVWLTDLSYVWTESLDRRQIKRKALNDESSIDPSEDSAQMLLFLKSIEDALQQCPGTSVNLDESNDIKQLALHTSTPLPLPLQPLEWSIVLILAPQSIFASEFVSPLLSQQLTAKAEKASLLKQLKEKDSVISKLIEKMQGDGVDLGKVFPGAVSSKSGTGPNVRRALASSIKGLGEFDQDHWEGQLAKDRGSSLHLDDLLPQIFNDHGKDAGEGLQIPDYGEWWKTVGRNNSQRKASTPATLEADAKEEIAVEGEFQRQSTPPKPSAQAPRREGLIMDTEPNMSTTLGKGYADEGGSTTDESDGDHQSSHSKPSLLRKDNAVVSASANGSKENYPQPMVLNDDGLTASASEIDDNSAKTHSVPKSKPKLGKIGGKGRDHSPEIPAVPRTKLKLGKIGGIGRLGKIGGTGSGSNQHEGAPSNRSEDPVSPKRETRDQTAAPMPSEPERRGRKIQRPPEPSPPRETSQERANRKREQLKRELESKSQAATKKKRRF
ncbi:MAG: hypothetical protein ALECFALPRED_005946 [Alectoria fallacina]|uniref:Non-homologous end-joining factor 1 n=1 Tax=Alectoria fallacina TaxID=1903189 RepID=A0A8H3IUS4_9LECA|nr:MAG: hypothetical protein ALECFALPRED_005946 [Alectoria fallacina]